MVLDFEIVSGPSGFPVLAAIGPKVISNCPGSQVAKKAVRCVTSPREIALLWNGPGGFETLEVGHFSE